jgi:hypothetical protein
VSIAWTENTVAINAQGTNTAGLQAPTYVLYVEP